MPRETKTPSREAVLKLKRDGRSVAEIARDSHLSPRHVKHIIADAHKQYRDLVRHFTVA